MARNLKLLLDSPIIMVGLFIWNLSYLLVNVHHWTEDWPWGWAATVFWLLLAMYSAYNLGKLRGYAERRQLIVMQTEMLRVQQEMLAQTVVVPIITGIQIVQTEDGSKKARIGLGPICPN